LGYGCEIQGGCERRELGNAVEDKAQAHRYRQEKTELNRRDRRERVKNKHVILFKEKL
jgi:hypothetical protein